MSGDDAAALLIALCVAETPSTAPEAVRTFLSLIPMAANRADTGQTSDELPSPLRDVAEAATFGEAISRLLQSGEAITALSDLSLHNLYTGFRSRSGGTPKLSDLRQFNFSVGFQLTERKGYIAVAWAKDASGSTTLFGRTFAESELKSRSQSVAMQIDRAVEVNLGPDTFIRLNRLLEAAQLPSPNPNG